MTALACAVGFFSGDEHMTKITEAIHSNGVLKPVEDLGLREGQRVRLTIEPLEERHQDRVAALARLKVGIAKMRFFSHGSLPTRDKRHRRP